MSTDRRPALAVMLFAMLVTGCDRGVDLTNASVEEVGAAAAKAERQRAGMWTVTTELETLDLGAMGTQAGTAQLKRQFGGKQTHRSCLTDKEASAVGIPGPGALGGARCRFDRFLMKGGLLDATMRCAAPTGQMIVSQKGSYSPTAYDLRSTVKQVTGGVGTSMTMHVTGERTGDCTRADLAPAANGPAAAASPNGAAR